MYFRRKVTLCANHAAADAAGEGLCSGVIKKKRRRDEQPAIRYRPSRPLIWRGFDMKNKTARMLAITQLVVVVLFLCLTVGNEIIDIPHYIFNDAPTSYSQRVGEIIIELSIFLIVTVIQIRLLKKLYKRIRILEGFLPICANCKKIRNAKDQWEEMEKYISKHSLARFSHSICPDCVRQLYPDYFTDDMGRTK
jgi:hypothetical protein